MSSARLVERAAIQTFAYSQYYMGYQMQEIPFIGLDIKSTGPVQINDTLQGQVANLQNDNQSFQTRVTALQETTSSLSAQIGALARQAQTAANAANQLQVRQTLGTL